MPSAARAAGSVRPVPCLPRRRFTPNNRLGQSARHLSVPRTASDTRVGNRLALSMPESSHAAGSGSANSVLTPSHSTRYAWPGHRRGIYLRPSMLTETPAQQRAWSAARPTASRDHHLTNQRPRLAATADGRRESDSPHPGNRNRAGTRAQSRANDAARGSQGPGGA